jgi:MOSC domain-containing protein YiiM
LVLDLGPFGRQGCVGAYAEVVHAGRIRVGQRLGVKPSQTAADDVITAEVARLVEQRGES